MSSLKETLVGYADWLGHGHPERAQAWVDRLEINRPEIDAFQALPTPDVPPWIATPTPLLPAAGDVPNAARPEADMPDAAAALETARQHPAWNIFITLAKTVPSVATGERAYLDGMPIAIKDLMAVKGFPLTCGSGAGGKDPGHDAAVVARIRRAGGAIVGTANLHELAYGITSANPHHGHVVNPIAPDRIPGGSSGGSAAAIAAGMAVAAVGTDTAGSIRIPAACCGIVGFKPSYGALPTQGVADLAPSLDHVGPMADNVEHCAELFAAMADCDRVPDWRIASLRGLRVAELGGYFEEPLDAAVKAAVHAAAHAAGNDGATCSRFTPADAAIAPAVQFQTICAEATASDAEILRTRPETLGEDVRVRLEMGVFLPGYLYAKAQRLRRQLVHNIDAAFAEADVLLCATLRSPAPKAGAATVDIGGRTYPLHTAVTQLTLPFNLTGLPALSLPWCVSADGVPIAIQIVGRRGADWQVLAVAERLQRAAPWTRQRASLTGKDGHASA